MTQSFDIVKLHFTGPLHLSKGKPDGYEAGSRILHSDALKSAMIAAAVQLRPKADCVSFLDSFDLTSAFPFWKEEYFFPKPLTHLAWKVQGKDERASNKILKEIAFLSKSFFEKALSATKGTQLLLDALSEDKTLLSDIFHAEDVLNKDEERFIFKTDINQRVAVPRWQESDTEGNTYYVERLFFREEAGLFFLIRFKKDADQLFWHEVLEHLGEQGVGTDRATGNGQFNPEYLQNGLQLQIPDEANMQMALSLFCPQKKEVNEALFAGAAYSLNKRGGWLTSRDDLLTYRKKSIYMFAEGSVFPKVELKGKVVDLKPEKVEELDHPVWRDGRAWFIPIKTL